MRPSGSLARRLLRVLPTAAWEGECVVYSIVFTILVILVLCLIENLSLSRKELERDQQSEMNRGTTDENKKKLRHPGSSRG